MAPKKPAPKVVRAANKVVRKELKDFDANLRSAGKTVVAMGVASKNKKHLAAVKKAAAAKKAKPHPTNIQQRKKDIKKYNKDKGYKTY